MPEWTDIGALALLGLLGSAHCLGMCGGFSMMAARGRWWGAYGAAKTATYAGLGALAGLAGHAVLRLSGAQEVLALLVGAALVAFGLAMAGVIPDGWTAPGKGSARLMAAVGHALSRKGPRGPGLLGLMNGLLPCGLVYAALMKAAGSGNALEGAALMSVFGMATLPALGALAWLSHRFSPGGRLALVRVGGWLVVLLGLVTLWRAFGAGTVH